jgi:hypothetical protein
VDSLPSFVGRRNYPEAVQWMKIVACNFLLRNQVGFSLLRSKRSLVKGRVKGTYFICMFLSIDDGNGEVFPSVEPPAAAFHWSETGGGSLSM